MLRMTPLASAIVALLLGIEAYAAEETFDTHFMIGGMKDQQVANIRLDDNQPLPGQYDIDIYVNKQWRGKYEIIVKDNPQDSVKQITIQGCGKAIPCIWNVDLPNFSARFAWVICTHQAIFLILFASEVCGCFVICRCCLTRNKILRHGCRGLLRVTRW